MELNTAKIFYIKDDKMAMELIITTHYKYFNNTWSKMSYIIFSFTFIINFKVLFKSKKKEEK